MPGNTGRLLLPYPTSTDAADVPKDVKALADRIELLNLWIRDVDLQAQSVGDSKLATSTLNKLYEPTPVNALPAGPVNGQVIAYRTAAMQAAGNFWMLMYDSSLPAWVFLGGAPIISEVPTEGTRNGAANYAGVAPAGPVVTPPIAGIYDLTFGAHVKSNTVGAQSLAALDGAGLVAADADAAQSDAAVAGQYTSMSHSIRRTLTAASVSLLYKTSAGTATFGRRWARLTPVRVG